MILSHDEPIGLVTASVSRGGVVDSQRDGAVRVGAVKCIKGRGG